MKLLRFLQEKRFQRVGGRQEIHSDTRVIAATNVNLQESVSKGTFREDLYFRLAVLVIKVPSLRERGDDVALMAKEFLHRYGAEQSKTQLVFTPDALRAMNFSCVARERPGAAEPGAARGDHGRRQTRHRQDLELADALNGAPAQTLKEARENLEREIVQEALSAIGGKMTPAAVELGISRPTLYELMEKLGIARE